MPSFREKPRKREGKDLSSREGITLSLPIRARGNELEMDLNIHVLGVYFHSLDRMLRSGGISVVESWRGNWIFFRLFSPPIIEGLPRPILRHSLLILQNLQSTGPLYSILRLNNPLKEGGLWTACYSPDRKHKESNSCGTFQEVSELSSQHLARPRGEPRLAYWWGEDFPRPPLPVVAEVDWVPRPPLLKGGVECINAIYIRR